MKTRTHYWYNKKSPAPFAHTFASCLHPVFVSYLNLDNILGGQVPPEHLIGHQRAVLLQHKLPSLVARQDAEVEGRAVVGGVLVHHGQLEDAGTDGLVLLRGPRTGTCQQALSQGPYTTIDCSCYRAVIIRRPID